MKKLLFLGALAAMLLGTASCSNDMEPTLGGEVPVNFAINLGDGIDSRAISDGTKANELTFYVFEDGKEIPALRQTVEVTGLHAQVTTRLVKGHTYSFVFWAQSSSCTAYTIENTENGYYLQVNYENDPEGFEAPANDENRDAFYRVINDYNVTDSFTENVVLTRPFAQVNILATDAASVTDFENYSSNLSCSNLSNKMNLLNGTVGDEVSYRSFGNASIPTENLPGYEQYKLLATGYFLAAEEKTLSSVNFTWIYDGHNSGHTIENVPIQRNYRTNIIGEWLTNPANYYIQVDPMYDGDLNKPNAIPAEEVATAVTVPGAKVVVEANSEFTLDLSTIAEGVTLDCNGSKIIMTSAMSESQRTINKNNVTIENFVLSNNGSFSSSLYPMRINAQNCTIRNMDLVDSYAGFFIAGTDPNGVILLDNCNFGRNEFSAHGITPYKCLIIYGTSTIHIKDCTFDSSAYPFNCDGSNCDVIVENSTLDGWTSFNCGTGHSVTFTNCRFARGFGDNYGSGYAVIRPYSTSYFDNCIFDKSMAFYPTNACESTFTGCTFMDREYFFVGCKPGDGQNCKITIDGVTYIDTTGTGTWTVVE